ncbi:hypothetical protein ACEPPN_000057 [Leptodophora sp. 'Broadleaf-Isolate-01']
MSAQSNQPPTRDNAMPSTTLEPPRTPGRSRSATPGLPQGSGANDHLASAPNQPPPPPPYKSPYSHQVPFPASNGDQTMASSKTYPRTTPQAYDRPRSLPPAAPTVPKVPAPSVPTLSHQALRGSEEIRSTAGYIAYSYELRKATAKNKVRSNRLSPVSHVQSTLDIVSDTVCVPSVDARLAGVLAGNPMINTVKVIKNLAEFNEDLADKIDDRDAYIRQLHDSQTQMQDSHAQAIKDAVDIAVSNALREAVRPLPKPTEQQAADLKARDDTIAALKEFIEDQTERIMGLEDARDAAQQLLEEAQSSNSQDLSLHHPRTYDENLGHGDDQGYNEDEGAEHGQEHGHDQGYEQDESYELDQGHGYHQGQNFVHGELQNFDPNQGFNAIAQTFGQAPAFNFSQYPDLDQDFSPNSNYFRDPPQYSQENQEGFRGQQDMSSQQVMGGQQGMLLHQGLESQANFMGQRVMPDLQGMEDPFFTLLQHDMHTMYTQQSPPRMQAIQGHHNSSTPNRRQRTPSQQSPPRSQTMQGQRNSSTQHRRQKRQKMIEEQEKITLSDLRDNLRKEQMENKQGGRYQDGFKRSF